MPRSRSASKEEVDRREEEAARQELLTNLEQWMIEDYREELTKHQNARTFKGMRKERTRGCRHHGNLLRDPSGMPLVPAVPVVPGSQYHNFKDQLRKSSLRKNYLTEPPNLWKIGIEDSTDSFESSSLSTSGSSVRRQRWSSTTSDESADLEIPLRPTGIQHRAASIIKHPEIMLAPDFTAVTKHSSAQWLENGTPVAENVTTQLYSAHKAEFTSQRKR